ncbi:unnamed protein product [Cyprideis torosa]|uniref:Uncharacterized protein n=1 Tax=Cyprideis torosa TaxID=163714 RepID=A0A7R8WCH0_9CRUS|nr:unnamed protein product [Cyprideis torosa]CAG0887991.1 unnamed protein product [Cyprideis torosa]
MELSQPDDDPYKPPASPCPSQEDFLSTGRTGRRNALPDIKDGSVATTSTAELPDILGNLSCSGPSTSGMQAAGGSAGDGQGTSSSSETSQGATGTTSSTSSEEQKKS